MNAVLDRIRPVARRALVAVAAAALVGCAHRPEPAGETDLPPPIRQALMAAGLAPHDLGLVVMPLDPRDRAAGREAVRHQADRPMQPASAMKVLTSAVALDRLGPNRRAHTELRTAAPIIEGALRGDLVLRGGADPELGLPQLWALLLELREAGVQRIEGDIVLDRTAFTPARMDLGVPPFDEAPEFPYNVIPDALQLAGNLHVLELQSDGQQVQARLRPALPGVQLDNQLQLHPRGTVACREWSGRGWRTPEAHAQPDGTVRVRLHGHFPADCVQRQSLQLMERNLLAQAQLRWVWESLGGQWRGRVREAQPGEAGVSDAAPGLRLIARREARPWGEWLRPINKVSDNVATRLLYLSLGVEEARRAHMPEAGGAAQATAIPPGRGHTLDWAEASVRRWFREQGITDDGLVLDNGSGLSRRECITPRQLALLLRAAHGQLHAPDLLMSLPIAGIDGSLRARMTEGPARGRARLKPGTLRNVVALAGYVDDVQNRRWVMVAFINHDEAPQRGRPVLDAVAHWVAAQGRPSNHRGLE